MSAGAGGKLKVPKSIADKVQALNDGGALAAPLRLGAVARALLELEKKTALELLDGLEAEADSIEDPNKWLTDAAAAVVDMLTGDQAAPEPAAAPPRRAAAPARPGAKAKAPAGWREGPQEGSTKVKAKQALRELNLSGMLQDVIRPEDFDIHFNLLGEAKSLAVVNELRESAANISKPNAWLKKQMGPVISLIVRLCTGAGLQEPLNPFSVRDILKDLPEEKALGILKQFEKIAASLEKPGSWIRGVAKKHRAALGLSGAGGPLSDAVAEELARLRREGQLKGRLDPQRAGRELQKLPEAKQYEIITFLEEHASSIPDPTGFICTKVQRVLQDPKAQSAGANASNPSNEPAVTLAEHVQKKIKWLSVRGGFAKQLNKARVEKQLGALTEQQQVQVLLKLKKNAAEVRDPNDFVKSECKTWRKAVAKLDTALSATLPEGTAKKIRWLQKLGGLAQPLNVEQTQSALLKLSPQQQTEVLTSLKRKVKEVNRPTAFVISECEKARMSSKEQEEGAGAGADAPGRKRAKKGEEEGEAGEPGEEAAEAAMEGLEQEGQEEEDAEEDPEQDAEDGETAQAEEGQDAGAEEEGPEGEEAAWEEAAGQAEAPEAEALDLDMPPEWLELG